MDNPLLRVLLIEDDTEFARRFCATLADVEHHQFHLQCEETLAGGLRRFGKEVFDAILVDLRRRDGRGLDVVYQLHRRCPDVPIVALIESDDAGVLPEAMRAGAEAGVAKRRLEPQRLIQVLRCASARVARQRIEEETLRENERRYHQLLSAVTTYTYSVQLVDGVPVSTAHSAGCELATGYTPEDYGADPYLWFRMVHHEDRERVQQYVACILGGEELLALEHRIIHRDSTIRWMRDKIIHYRDDTGRLVGYDGLVEDVTEQKRAEQAFREDEANLLAARRTQARLLPQTVPHLPGLDIFGAVHPAEFTAGDYFDYLAMTDQAIGLVVADVSGHDLSSALLMASTCTLLRLLAETHQEVGEILTRANCFLAKETDEHFVTLLLARLDLSSRTLVYANAGHPAGYLIGRDGGVKACLESTALPLAVSADAEFPTGIPVTLEPGDTLLLMTDGILETCSQQGEPFGAARALQTLLANRHCTAREIVERLCRAVCDFALPAKIIDDVTALVVKVAPGATDGASPKLPRAAVS
ncbi:MAG: SpoIIE family protein phosphatase [Planctomycetota bacterium]|nr:SpoIIE family protein phosphatase [Planctomycetota bacterium]